MNIKLTDDDRVADLRKIDRDRKGVDAAFRVAMDMVAEQYSEIHARSVKFWDALAARHGLDTVDKRYIIEYRPDGDYLVEAPGAKYAGEAEKAVLEREDGV